MNAKKVKAIRKNLKANNVDVKASEYESSFMNKHTYTLVAGCGRLFYKNTKKQSKSMFGLK